MTALFSPDIIDQFIQEVSFNANGLIPAIAQDNQSGEILMMAWMNEESLRITLKEMTACYWSRSRAKLWRKGESSGQQQHVKQIFLDCDGDTLIIKVDQTGVACHTGRRNCFYKELTEYGLKEAHEVVTPPEQLYK